MREGDERGNGSAVLGLFKLISGAEINCAWSGQNSVWDGVCGHRRFFEFRAY